MGKFDRCHLIIFTSDKLPEDKLSLVIKETAGSVDVVTDLETVASQVQTTMADAIIIIKDKEKDSDIVRNLRENAKIDQVPILAVESIEDAMKVIPLLLESKL